MASITLEVDRGVELPFDDSPDKALIEHVVDIINDDSVVLADVDKLVDMDEVVDKNVIGIIEVIDIVVEDEAVDDVVKVDVIGGGRNFVATVEGGRDSCKGGADGGRMAGETGGRLGAMVGKGWIVEGGRGGATAGRGRFNPPPAKEVSV